MNLATADEVAFALKRLGAYRVRQAQTVANQGMPDGISGALLLAFGMRETWLQNVEGGARRVDGVWVPEDRPEHMDVGAFQISRFYHEMALRQMPGVVSGTWAPVIRGKTAADSGYVPQFTVALNYTLNELHEAMAFAGDRGIGDRVRFAIAAHNTGIGGASQGAHEGDVDKYTSGGDYSAWVLDARTKINHWLTQHPTWRIAA